mgnify:CR=1 FL=1
MAALVFRMVFVFGDVKLPILGQRLRKIGPLLGARLLHADHTGPDITDHPHAGLPAGLPRQIARVGLGRHPDIERHYFQRGLYGWNFVFRRAHGREQRCADQRQSIFIDSSHRRHLLYRMAK